MTNEELVRLIQEGVDITNNMGILYEQNIPLIEMIVKPFSTLVEMDDLMQEAYFGIRKAVEGFDPENNNKFMSYATYKIRSACFRYIEKNVRSKRIPSHMLQKISKYNKYIKDYKQMNNGGFPDDEMIMKHMEMTKRQYSSFLRIIVESQCVSLNESLDDSDGGSLADIIADDSDFEEDILKESMSDELWNQINHLQDKRQRDVIFSRYKYSKTQGTVAEEQMVSPSYIGVIEQKALRLLKNNDRLQEIAEGFGYDCKEAYTYGVGRFKHSGTSSTEFLALKRVELMYKEKNINSRFEELISMV